MTEKMTNKYSNECYINIDYSINLKMFKENKISINGRIQNHNKIIHKTNIFLYHDGGKKALCPLDCKWLLWPMKACNTWGIKCALPILKKL